MRPEVASPSRRAACLTAGASLLLGYFAAEELWPEPRGGCNSTRGAGARNAPQDAVLGLARYTLDASARPPWDVGLRIFVGSLRATGYRGAIVLWVHPAMLSESPPPNLKAARAWLELQQVQLHPVDTAPCDFPFKPTEDHQELRKLCAAAHRGMPLEWARFQLALDWVRGGCIPRGCGWVLVTDVRDTYFQRPPFTDLGDPSGSAAMVFEEWYGERGKTLEGGKKYGVDTTHWFAKMATHCYGEDTYREYSGSAMLCSGQLLGTARGIEALLGAYTSEMRRNAGKHAGCVPPELPDQPLLNHLFYHKRLGGTRAVPYGEGPVLTVGITCTRALPGRATVDENLNRDAAGFVLDGRGRRAPVVHQWDRCGARFEHWLRRWVAAEGHLALDGRWRAPLGQAAAPPPAALQRRTRGRDGSLWRDCAAENADCDCTTVARFGDEKGDRWSLHSIEPPATKVPCLNVFAGGPFPDPAPNTPKRCQCKVK
eukprot:TRINITY_DN23701_c0_g1_i1.p2 TRINITY_DN23701_c0_g1~~TRINITY_DN23701_c0_g1_i1.p2  ORF type:complete len:485 (+),score=115.88 TRINITY_DN23701_c0_g1_i1:80-1534(+)